MSKEFGEALRAFRRKCGLTQRQVADSLHLDRSTYAYYERGTTEPSLGTVRKLAKIFNISVEELLPSAESRPTMMVSDITSQRSQKAATEDALLEWYRGLSPEQIEKFKDFVRQTKEEN